MVAQQVHRKVWSHRRGMIGIRTEKVKVNFAANNSWANFVFYKEFKLMPLSELKEFINQFDNLLEVPKNSEVRATGFDIAEIQSMLL